MAARVSKTDEAYEALRDKITFQALAPGELISEALLMEMTGFGRTPVREALQRLARDRMVEIHPNRGVFVAQTSIEAHFRLLELRRALEELTARLAVHRADTRQKALMLKLAERIDAFAGADIRAFENLLRGAHDSLAAAANNEYLQLAMAPLQGLSRRFWFANLSDRPAEDLRRACELHGPILRAVCHADEEAAVIASLQLNDYLIDFTYHTLIPTERTTATGRST